MDLALAAVVVVAAIAVLAVLLFRLRSADKKTVKPYYLDLDEGAILVLGAPGLELTLASFRRTAGKVSFDVLARNTGGKPLPETVVKIDGSEAVFNGLAGSELKSREVSFTRIRETAELEVSAHGKKTYSAKLPLASLLRELAEKDKITVIEEKQAPKPQNDKELREKIVQDFEIQLGARKPAETEEAEELIEQEKEVERKFLKRELNADTFYKIMQDIEKRKIEITAKKNVKRRA